MTVTAPPAARTAALTVPSGERTVRLRASATGAQISRQAPTSPAVRRFPIGTTLASFRVGYAADTQSFACSSSATLNTRASPGIIHANIRVARAIHSMSVTIAERSQASW